MSEPLVLSIDLGGTQLRAAMVDSSGRLQKRAATTTDVAGGPKAIIAQMLHLADEVGLSQSRESIIGVGVAAPGPLDSDTGTILDIPTIPGWINFPLRRVLSETLDLPVVLENDGIASAFGEWKFGAGKGLSHLVYVTVSTGIGGGVVADGKILRGRRGMAGHVGHMMISPEGPRCACGGVGCFEALASGTALGALGRVKGFENARAVVEAARIGNQDALELLDREADYLGYGFASLLHLYSPERLIMGGGVSQALDLMLPRIRQHIDNLAMPPFRSVEIVPAQLDDNAGLVGAAGLVLFREASSGLHNKAY